MQKLQELTLAELYSMQLHKKRLTYMRIMAAGGTDREVQWQHKSQQGG
jgi:hypothetical protein